MARCIKRERRGNLNFLAYPTVGLSHCLVQDKQLELAHATAYYKPAPSIQRTKDTGIIHPNADVPVASLLDLNVRDSTAEDNVRKRPFYHNVMTPSPCELTGVGGKDTNNSGNLQIIREEIARGHEKV